MIIDLIKKIIPSKFHPLNYFSQRAIKQLKGVVKQGPFKGMKYIDKAHVGFVCHKLTGTYEKEIQHIIHDELNKSYDAIIDVGSAEGYYAVGMALFGKSSTVVSFEGTARGRELQIRLAKLNNVDHKISIKEYCDAESLYIEMSKFKDCLLICDVDGFELALLNINLNSHLSHTTMIIECHNHCYSSMEKDLMERFSETHDIISIPVRKCVDYSDYPNPNFWYKILPKKYKDFPIRETERAVEDSWLYLKPKKLY
jgi:hypothetical protein